MASPCGEKEVNKFEIQIDKKGVKNLVMLDEKEDIYTPKQLLKDSVDVQKILERVTRTGDTTALKAREGVFGDLTKMPSSPIEAYNLTARVKQRFDALPAKVKAEFGYNAFEMANAELNGTARERVNKALGIKETKKVTEEPVKIATATPTAEQIQAYLNSQNQNKEANN